MSAAIEVQQLRKTYEVPVVDLTVEDPQIEEVIEQAFSQEVV